MSVLLATVPCACRLVDSLYDNNSKASNSYFGSFGRTFDSKNVEYYCPVRTPLSFITFSITLLQTTFGSTLR